MGLLDSIFTSQEIDDVSILPSHIALVYQGPYRLLGLEDDASVALVRDAFRKNCINFISDFSGLAQPKMTVLQLFLAYHLCRKTVTGPAKKLKEELKTSPYLNNISPRDILPLLRPLRSSKFPCDAGYRGFRQFTVVLVEYNTDYSGGVIPTTRYKFDVQYCMRRHKIEVMRSTLDFSTSNMNKLFYRKHMRRFTTYTG